MNCGHESKLATLLRDHESEVLGEWVAHQISASTFRRDLIKETELREQSREFLACLRDALQRTDSSDIRAPEWGAVRAMLAGISRSPAKQGFSPSETATFVFSLKQPIFTRLRQALGHDGTALADETLATSMLMDKLGLWTTETYQ